jgi:hypothetical protein
MRGSHSALYLQMLKIAALLGCLPLWAGFVQRPPARPAWNPPLSIADSVRALFPTEEVV